MAKQHVTMQSKIGPAKEQAGLTTGHLKPTPTPKPASTPAKPKK